MSKINTEPVRKEIVTMIGELKSLIRAYMANREEIAQIEEKIELAREYKDGQISELNQSLVNNTKAIFERLREEQENLAEFSCCSRMAARCSRSRSETACWRLT